MPAGLAVGLAPKEWRYADRDSPRRRCRLRVPRSLSLQGIRLNCLQIGALPEAGTLADSRFERPPQRG
jgi:hypothetical protein